MFYKNDVLKNFVIFTAKRPLESLFNKIVDTYLEEYLRAAASTTPENLDFSGFKMETTARNGLVDNITTACFCS